MSARRRRQLAPLGPMRARAIVAILLVAAPFLGGCDSDSDDESFETPNEVDGSTTDGAPEGTVDSRDEGTPDGS